MWVACSFFAWSKKRWTFLQYCLRAFIWPFKINMKQTSQLRFSKNKGEGWQVHSKRTIYTLKPFNKAHQPTWKWLTSHKERIWKNIWSMWELRIHPHVQNTLSLQHTSGKNTKRKTIKTMYASCYTERHSVWYVVYYCKHILTDICYRVERKGRLCPRMAILSCKFVTLHVVQEVYATGLQKPVSG